MTEAATGARPTPATVGERAGSDGGRDRGEHTDGDAEHAERTERDKRGDDGSQGSHASQGGQGGRRDGAPEPGSATPRTPEYPLPPGDGLFDLLVWDAPNVDATLSQVIGAKPTAANRPRYDAIARWLVERAGDREVEGAVFANVPPSLAGQMRGWVEALRSLGFAVFARPKLADGDDVDEAMLAHVHHRARSGRLGRLVVASGDGRNFLRPLEDLAQAGVQITVLSFFEVAGYAAESPHIEFVDLEELPGAFLSPLDRIRLDSLPVGGAWLRPTGSLREAAAG